MRAPTGVFEMYGGFVEASVRRRVDFAGVNTSWALVTMADKAAAERALDAKISVSGRLLGISKFSRKVCVEFYLMKWALLWAQCLRI